MVVQWLDSRASVCSASDSLPADLEEEGFATRLYHACLHVLTRTCQKGYSDDHDGSHLFEMKEALGKLYLWGANLKSGDLDAALDPFEDLRSNVLELLGDIGRLVLRDATKSGKMRHGSNWAVAGQQFPGLYSLVEEVDLILSEDYDHSLDEDLDDSDISRSLDFSIRCLTDLAPTLEQSLAYGDQIQAPKPPTDVAFNVSEPARAYVSMIQQRYQSVDRKLVERLGEANWRRHVKVRKQLDESMSGRGLEYASDEAISEGIGSTTSLLKPYSEFHDSAMGTSKTGSSRGARSIRSSPLTRPSSTSSDIGPETQRGIDQTLLGSKQQIWRTQSPSAIPRGISDFEDSALGSDIEGRRLDLTTLGSHISSASLDETSVARILPMPEGFARGKAFKCDYCGEIISKIRNRTDWSEHVFADLRPYICTFEDCRHELAQFSTREAWAAHEFSEHRSCRWWACPECSVECSSSFSWVDHVARTHPAFTKATTSSASGLLMAKTAAYRQGERPIEDEKCPLCDAIPGFSRRTFVDHVCRHMEELSLAVLPRREVADIPDKASADEVFEPELSRIESDAEDSVASEVSQEDQDTGMGSLSNQWSEQQQQEFPQLIHCFGTNFAAIAQTRIMSDKTAAKIRKHYNNCIEKEATGEALEQLAYIADKASRQIVVRAHNIQRRIQTQRENGKEYLLDIGQEQRISAITAKKTELSIEDVRATLEGVQQQDALLADYEAGTNFLPPNDILGPDDRGRCLNEPKYIVNPRWHKCLRCRMLFLHFDQLRKHLAGVHQDNCSLVCDRCDSISSDLEDFYQHYKPHLEEKAQQEGSWVCEICDKALNGLSELASHIQGHFKEITHICHDCKREFSNAVALSGHTRRGESACVRDPSTIEEAGAEPAGTVESSLDEASSHGASGLVGEESGERPTKDTFSRYRYTMKRVRKFVEERTVIKAWNLLENSYKDGTGTRLEKVRRFFGKVPEKRPGGPRPSELVEWSSSQNRSG